jgi:hypothetical protein
MERLLKQRSHYHLVRKYLHPLNLSQLHQKEMLQNLIMLLLTLRKMVVPGAQERHLLNGKQGFLREGDHLYLGEAYHLEGDHLILPIAGGRALLSAVAVIHLLDVGQHHHLEAVLHLLPLQDDIDLLQGAPLEEFVAVLFEEGLLFL